MKTVIQDLQKWTNEFEENASYYQGDYMRGMFHILNGINSQLYRWENKEKQELKEAFIAGVWDTSGIEDDNELFEQYYNETYD